MHVFDEFFALYLLVYFENFKILPTTNIENLYFTELFAMEQNLYTGGRLMCNCGTYSGFLAKVSIVFHDEFGLQQKQEI
jgi:hypothetical protein